MKKLQAIRIIVFITIGFILPAFTLPGCSWFKSKEEKTAQELIDEGMESFNKHNYKNAITSFEQLKDWYPFSSFATVAELKIADAHYELEEYEEAVSAYEEFESLHPRNESVPYIVYQTGRCYFDQIDTIDRDQSTAKKALDTFNRLKKQFPESNYSAMAGEHIKKCLKSLAANELYIGVYYYKSKHYEAAIKRFNAVISDYPDVGIYNEAFRYITLCEQEMAKQTEEKNS